MSFRPGTTYKDLSDQELEKVLNALKEPFDPEDIDWKPQGIKNGNATALAFADPRVYIDRLNEIVGAANWTRKFNFTVTPYSKVVKGRAPYGAPPSTPVPPDTVVNGNKVICTASVTVLGMEQSSTGETDASDDNAATSSEAQSFKRACIGYGLGRYLYDLPKFEAPYAYGKFTKKPELPDWAIPKKPCDNCDKTIAPVEINGKTYSASWLINNSKSKYGQQLCSVCQTAKAKERQAAGVR